MKALVSHKTYTEQDSMFWPGLRFHTCNPNYLGGRDQEDCNSGQIQATSKRPYLRKIANAKKGLRGHLKW
jgi:hypothetical protein